jgi:hypothetical protein
VTVAQQQVDWAESLLLDLGSPVDYYNLTSVVAWEIAEGGWFANDATFNPLDTTQQMPGSVGVVDTGNGIYVQAYVSLEQGIEATTITLHNGFYDDILAGLYTSNVPYDTIFAIAVSPWGTLLSGLEAALPYAQQVVLANWLPAEVEPMFIKEPDGTVYHLIYGGAESYWRKVPASANLTGLTVVDDSNGVWLSLWKVGAAA